MARYIPADEMARRIAQDWLRDAVNRQWSSVTAQIGEMNDDGVCPLYLRAEPEQFDLSAFFDVPQLDGQCWIESNGYPRLEFDFGSPIQPAAFIREYGR
jgi:hypothetical protein